MVPALRLSSRSPALRAASGGVLGDLAGIGVEQRDGADRQRPAQQLHEHEHADRARGDAGEVSLSDRPTVMAT